MLFCLQKKKKKKKKNQVLVICNEYREICDKI